VAAAASASVAAIQPVKVFLDNGFNLCGFICENRR